MRGEETNVLHEMWSMILHIFRSPPLPFSFPSLLSPSSPSTSTTRPQISTTAFGLLFIGISMALMLFGIVTFFIGFLLMPLVIILLMIFYFVGIVSKISEIARSILWPTTDCTKVAPVGLFILLSPGLLFQLPARTSFIEFGNMYTSGISILMHAILYFCIYTLLVIAIGVHLHAD